MVIDVIRNITISGNTPSMIRHALLNGDGLPGRCGAFWNMKYISVMISARHDEDHRDAAVVGGELAQDSRGGREIRAAGSAGCGCGAVPDDGQKRFLQ